MQSEEPKGRNRIENCFGSRHLPSLTGARRDRALGEDPIQKVRGGNFLRVFEQVLGRLGLMGRASRRRRADSREPEAWTSIGLRCSLTPS